MRVWWLERKGETDIMRLQVLGNTDEINIAEISNHLTAICKLKGAVEQVFELPNDGKVIDDQRDYSK